MGAAAALFGAIPSSRPDVAGSALDQTPSREPQVFMCRLLMNKPSINKEVFQSKWGGINQESTLRKCLIKSTCLQSLGPRVFFVWGGRRVCVMGFLNIFAGVLIMFCLRLNLLLEGQSGAPKGRQGRHTVVFGALQYVDVPGPAPATDSDWCLTMCSRI